VAAESGFEFLRETSACVALLANLARHLNGTCDAQLWFGRGEEHNIGSIEPEAAAP
jgi:hypothetical protein